jgi:hypothetical protein
MRVTRTNRAGTGILSSVNTFDGVNRGDMLPERKWTGDFREDSKAIRSNIPHSALYNLLDAEGFDMVTASAYDAAGVTADQYFEAFDLLGSKFFGLVESARPTDANFKLLRASLKEKGATMDLRFAFYLARGIIDAPVVDSVPVARKLGYTQFFEYVTSGFSLEGIKSIIDNEVDPELLSSLFAGAA